MWLDVIKCSLTNYTVLSYWCTFRLNCTITHILCRRHILIYISWVSSLLNVASAGWRTSYKVSCSVCCDCEDAFRIPWKCMSIPSFLPWTDVQIKELKRMRCKPQSCHWTHLHNQTQQQNTPTQHSLHALHTQKETDLFVRANKFTPTNPNTYLLNFRVPPLFKKH